MKASTKHRLEAAYGRLPVSIQNLIFSGYGWLRKKERYGPVFRSTLKEYQQSDFWDKQRISEYQSERLVDIIRAASQNVPFYRNLFKEYGLKSQQIQSPDDLKLIPELAKKTLRLRAEEFIDPSVTSTVSTLTSGTTGSPLRVKFERDAFQRLWAMSWRHRGRFGLELGTPFLMFGARLPVPIRQQRLPVWRTNYAINQTYMSTYHMTPELLPGIVNWLNRKKFRFFLGYPSAIYSLAIGMESQSLNLDYRPDRIITGSDALIPGFKDKIESFFGCKTTERYGMAEGAGNLSKCEHGKFHLDSEASILEPLPTKLEDASGRTIYRMVFTGLLNKAMPLIRYDVGDLCTLSDSSCSCGRSSTVVESIDGRTEDFIRTPDGRMVIGMNQAFEWAPGVEETQIVQDTVDSILCRVVVGTQFNRAHDLGILRREFQSRLGDGISVDFEIVNSIPRVGTGKFRAVICNVPTENAAEQELRDTIAGQPREL